MAQVSGWCSIGQHSSMLNVRPNHTRTYIPTSLVL